MTRTQEKIRKCFWIFFFFVLTEGIFRRWLLPGLNNVFLVIRDPFVIYAVLIGSKYIKSDLAKGMMVLGGLNFITTMICGHGNFFVAIYGLRITMFYFPFMYICGHVLTTDDLYKMGRILVYMIIPMVALNIVQFFSPQSSFVNIGVGGDETGAGFGGAMGYFRPPGIFTFIAGLTDYYGVAFGFLLYFLLNKDKCGISKNILMGSLIAYFISVPVSISRTHFVQTALILAFFFMVSLNNKAATQKILLLVFLTALLSPLLMQIEEVRLFLEVFFARFDGANESEGGLGNSAVNRTFGWLMNALENDVPFFGFGDGTFSNFGMTILTGGTNGSEGIYKGVADSTEMEWGRLVCENGILLGLTGLCIRMMMAWTLFKRSLRLYRFKLYFPWLLFPYAAYLLAFGQLKAPYNLGFTTIIVVALIVAIREGKQIRIMNRHEESTNLPHRR